MSLRARLRTFIILLVAVVVGVLSVINVRDAIETRLSDALYLATSNAEVVESFLIPLVNEKASRRIPQPETLDEMKRVWTQIVELDTDLALFLQRMTGGARYIVEIVITGEDNRILAASLPSRQGQKLELPPELTEFTSRTLTDRVNEIVAPNRDYRVTRELGLQGQDDPILAVHVIVSTVLLRNEVLPQIINLGFVSAIALLISVVIAAIASRWAFKPLARIGEVIDRIARGETTREESGSVSREEAAVESKLSLLGKQFHGAQADVAELRSNLDQLMDRMEEAVLLFGRNDRLALAGRGAERLLNLGRWEVMGKHLHDVFPSSTEMGAIVQGAVHVQREVRDRPLVLERPDGSNVEVLLTVEVVEDFPSRERAGTLVTIREAAPRRQIESQLDISTRLAAISRLTSGAAHEIKNPLNSIVLHLEVLKNKLQYSDSQAETELRVISREITRLDRVVKSFLDFTRPVELNMAAIDLVEIASEVATLVRTEAAGQPVEVVVDKKVETARMQGDRDLLMQAILNVVVNGAEAMTNGGTLTISVEESAGMWLLKVQDEGAGIPVELQEKIYNLYFSTKGKGTGIGLAMTFRVVQLHSGTIDFTSKQNEGTTFRLRFPRDRSGQSGGASNVEERTESRMGANGA